MRGEEVRGEEVKGEVGEVKGDEVEEWCLTHCSQVSSLRGRGGEKTPPPPDPPPESQRQLKQSITTFTP